MICGLPHRKRKKKKADKLSEKLTDITTERFLQFLSSSAWLCIFWIYIDSNKEKREKVRESPFINDTDNLIFQIILSLLHESYIFYYNNILFIYWLILFRFWNLLNLDCKKDILYKIQPSLLTGVFLLLSRAVNAFTRRMLTLLSLDKILLPRYLNMSTNFWGLSHKMETVGWLVLWHINLCGLFNAK